MSEFDPKHYARSLLSSMRNLSPKFSKPVPVDRLRALCHAVLEEPQEKERPPLTDVEQSVLAAIKGDLAQGIQPTVRSVQERLQYGSPNSARVVIDRLIEHGYLKREGNKKQIVVVTQPH
jgi:hypothetical protein